LAEEACDVGIITDLATRLTANITTEAVDSGVELLQDNCLRLNFTNLFDNGPLDKFAYDSQSLLDDLDVDLLTDDLFLLDKDLLIRAAVEVRGTKEAVEVGQGAQAIEVVEAGVPSGVGDGRNVTLGVNGGANSSGTEGEDGDELENGGDHDDK